LLDHDLFRKPVPTFRDHARQYNYLHSVVKLNRYVNLGLKFMVNEAGACPIFAPFHAD